jgi:hypothetical protein
VMCQIGNAAKDPEKDVKKENVEYLFLIQK